MKIAPFSLSLVALLFVTEGCFQYIPGSDVAPVRGTPIRLHLERPASFELTQVTVNNITGVEGELVAREGGNVILSATWLTSGASPGTGFDGEGWTLRIPETNVTSFELKRLSWWRTGAVLLGGGIATFFGFDALGTGDEGSGGVPTGGQQL